MSNGNRSGDGATNSLDRRTFLKVTSGACAGIGMAGHAAASGKYAGQKATVEGDLPHPNLGTLRIDDSVKSVTPHYHLLTLRKDRVLELIGKSDVKGSKQNAIREFLKDAWRKYPVKRSKEDNDTVVSLTKGHESTGQLENEHKHFSTAVRAMGRGYAIESREGSGLSAQWIDTTHQDITEVVCEHNDTLQGLRDLYEDGDIYVDEDPIDAITGHSDDPDYDPCGECFSLFSNSDWQDVPDYAIDPIKDGFDKLARHYNHYYNPRVYDQDYDGERVAYDGIGAAPRVCSYEMQQSQDTTNGPVQNEHLGRALHYVQDVANPLHSGMGLGQMGFDISCGWLGCGASIDPRKELHLGYENYVDDNLHSGENFIDYVDYNIGTKDETKDPDDLVMDCSIDSNVYSENVYDLMMTWGNDPDDWPDDPRNQLNYINENCMALAGSFSYALIEQIY